MSSIASLLHCTTPKLLPSPLSGTITLFPPFYAGADCHDVDDHHWINGHPTPVANPMSSYPRYQQYRKSWGINALGSVIVEVETEDGTTGVGET